MDEGLKNLVDRIECGDMSSYDDIPRLLACEDTDTAQYLFERADAVKRARFGDEILTRAIVEFSNHCRCLCAYCGISACNEGIARYRMTREEILASAREALDQGYHTVILQSGEDLFYTKEMIGGIVRDIKAMGREYPFPVAVTLSVGERDYETYRYWRQCGADRYLIKHETSDEALYNRYHPHSSLEKRLQCQKWLYELGYELGGGFMVGLPGQTYETLKNDILLLKTMKVSMAGIGPYISHHATPLAGSPHGSPELTRRVLAVARLILPQVHLPSTTALNLKGGKEAALSGGANVVMNKVTPLKYRALYDLYEP